MLGRKTKLTPEQRIEKAVVSIMHHNNYRRLSGILMVGSRSVGTHIGTHNVDTAATNGKDEVYNPDFIAKLSDPELRFLILHENYHKLYKHLTTWRWMYQENAQAANMACDYVINIKLSDAHKVDKFATMTGELVNGCYDEKYRDWDSARVFRDLMKNAKNDSKGGRSGPNNGQGFDQHDWDGAKDMTAEEKAELAREIDEAIRQGQIVAGKTGSGGDRSIEELLKPQVDWREAFRDFVTSTCAGNDFSTWKKPNRRYIGAGYYMPTTFSETVEDIVLAIDTSGSIGGRELASWLTEAKSIADSVKPAKVHIMYWDTRVARHEVYERHELDNMIQSTKPAGGGGTSVECVPEFMGANGIRPQAVVVLTDGYLGGSWGQWSCPVLWTILNNKRANPSVGTVIHIEEHQL